MPVYRQCELLGLSRAAYYYKPRPADGLNEVLMRLLDEQYTRTPFYGVPKMTAWLRRQGYRVNPKRVRRLMRLMGLSAVYPKPWTSKPVKGHKKYPYLLRDVVVDRADQVWSTDITYIRLRQGFIYLVVIMDWHSRYVLSWLRIPLHADHLLRLKPTTRYDACRPVLRSDADHFSVFFVMVVGMS